MILDIKLACPKCGCQSPFKAFQAPEEIWEIPRLAAKFGKNWSWVEDYLGCFRSSYDKPLKIGRVKIFLNELLTYIDQNGFNIDKHWYTIRPDALFAAIRYVAQTDKIGFKNHNYLKKVAIDMNKKMIDREETEQREKKNKASQRFQRDPSTPERIKDILAKIK
jgi:hypothetical protein